ncbi:MAG: ADP-ribosylglycohydrolase family protein [Candidatus Helarchaeota archaeon]|nr:ADP-ribosylglycohydrolase family protein [Candidatus Helarchaeota archaeon]
MEKLRDRFIGTLIGTAVGDALGRPFEGWSRRQIEARVGRVTELLPDLGWRSGGAGQYTDDTQLTIAIAESLIRSEGFNLGDLMKRFIDWLDEPPIGPGYGCLSSIRKFRLGYAWQEAASDSGGNGTAMRVSPIGLFFYNDIPKLIESARMSSVITHTHWAATASAIVVARSVAYLIQSDSLDLDDFLQTIAASVDDPAFEDYAQNITALKEYLKMDKIEALIELGGKGIKPPWPNPAETRQGYIAAYAMSTTLSALYCFLLSPDDFEKSVVEAVMSGGDTDTCGAITGALSGSYNGLEKIPEKWIKSTVNNENIKQLAIQLYETVYKL